MKFKLTSSQMNFYTKNISLDSSIWNQGVLEVFPKVYTYKQLNDAYNRLVQANDSLRVKIKEIENEPITYIEDFEYTEWPFIQVNSDEELMLSANDFINSQTDPYGRLVRCIIFQTPTTSGVLICAHHIVVDGYSAFVMSEHINQYLQDLNYTPPAQQSYSEYIEKEEKHKNSKRFLSDREFWKKQFETNPVCDLFSSQNNMPDFSSSEIDYEIPYTLLKKVKSFCKANEISPATFFNTVYATYINRVFDVEHFTIGVPVLNRTTQAELNTIGLYMHIVPLVVNLQSDSFLANAYRIEDSWMNIFRHQKFTQQDIKNMLKEENLPVNTLFDFAADFLEFEPNKDYETRITYINSLTIPLEFHLHAFSENHIALKALYRTALFTEKEINAMLNSIFAIAEDALTNPDKKICKLEMISSAERQKLLCEFNATYADFPRDKCIHTLFENVAKEKPNTTAVIASDKALTYKELDEESNRIANSLIEKGVQSGDIVAFCLERNSYVFSVILGILKTGATYLPIDMNYPTDRKEFMLSDSKAKYCVTEETVKELLSNTNTVNPNRQISSEMGCYCIYTSGSTGTPKGTLIRHRNAVNLCYNNEHSMYSEVYSSCQTICSMATLGFDMVIAETLVPLLNGMTIVFANENESKIPYYAKVMFEQNKIDVFQSTPTKLKLFIDGGVCLDGVRAIIVGGESLEPAFFNQLKNSCNAKIYNFYGPTETTVWSSFAEVTDAEDIHIGKPITNTQIYIIDKKLNPTPIGVVGELCIAGDGVCAGYLNRPEQTAEKFIDNPFGNGKLYRTGDLAYWREDGNINFIGRNDFQVKIRGQRIELGEIENAVASVDGVVQCAVVVRKDEEDRQYICAFYTGEEKDGRELRAILGTHLPKYMVPHIFTHIEEMPLTSSGKINRKGLPQIALNNISAETEYLAPETEEEKAVCEAIEEVLKTERVSVLENFFDMGGDSLKSIELTSKLEDKGYTVNVKSIFESVNIQDLAKQLTEKTTENETVEYGNVIPVTAAQMTVYTAQMIDGKSTLYNIPYTFRVKELNTEQLEKAINELIARHESFRTHFENRNGQIVQVINETATVEIEKLESDNPTDFIKPFTLTKAPLLRVGYYENTVMIDLHHIIADGSSVAIFFKELNELYMGRKLTDTVQYGEFAVTYTYTEDDEAYWLKEYEDVPSLELVTDFPKPETQSFNGTNNYTYIDNGLHENILSKCKQLGITPYAYYMACYNILLSKYSGSEDICVGMPISGRSSKYLNTMGMFVNTIALRNQPLGTKTFVDFVNEVKEKSLEAINHQKYSHHELAKKTGSKKAIFDVMFAYQSEEMTDIALGDKKAEVLPTPVTTSKCDLSFYVLPRENDIVLMVEYCTDLYKEGTVNTFIEAYNSILVQSLNEETLIKDISVLTKNEETTILNTFNNTEAEYPQDKCIHELFEAQAEKTPDKIALVAVDKTLTYRELNEEANRIAHSLLEKGIGKGDIVGLMLPRKSCLLSALFGILKTGAAYLPIDMELPSERIEFMCKDTGASLVVSSDNIDSLMQSDNITNPCVEMTNDALCYCIYTSGSTGQPKGVMARHRNVVNYISKNEHNIFGKIIKEDFEAIVSISTCSFDIFVTETIATLVNGLRVVLADEQQCRNQYALNELLSNEKGEFLQTTPTKLKVLTAEPTQREFLKNVKAILLGGEAMELSYLNELKKMTNAKIYNIYGTTEVPIWSTFADTDTFVDAVTVGKPIANTQVYIVDKYLNPTPMGVMGELCIAGDSVSSGYLNRPEQTTEKFVDNPFGKGKLYRTGDLAYWREDGNIVYIGRNDFQVKIRGLRIELGEIESVLQTVEGIERAVVVVRKDSEDRQLICAFYTGQEKSAKELRTAIGGRLPKYMIPHIFTYLEKMPMTASGKANRNALPEIDLENISTETEYVAPVTEEEKAVCEAVETVLKTEKVSVLENFFDMGGDSLKSIELTSKLEDKGYTINVKSIFESVNIQDLAKQLTEKTTKEETVEYGNVIPATAAQMRVYTSQFMKPDSTHYNIPYDFKVEDLDAGRLQKAITQLVERHESLRTRFENRDGQIMQIIEEKATICIEKLEGDDVSAFNTPFDLTKAPLLRIGYYENTVMVVMHHIIADGESMSVFFKELNELYMDRELKDTVQYGEFAVTDKYTEENEKYWLDVFSDEVSTLELPTDFARGENQSFNGTAMYDLIDIKLHEKILDKCKKLNITPYVFYMTCYNVLLSKLSGNEDICVGMPVSGRTSKFLNTVGMFVNTIALRTNTNGNKTMATLMQEVRENSISAIDNQNYPFNELVKKLNINVINRNPLFDVMFVYQSEQLLNIVLGDKKAELMPVPLAGVKCDFNFNIMPRETDVVFMVEYCSDLYSEETTQKLMERYKALLEVCLDETKQIKDIEIITEEEKNIVLNDFNNTKHIYNIPEHSTIYSLFEEKAKVNKEKVCVTANGKNMTYGELLNIVESLDAELRKLTYNEKSIIAVIAERSVEMYSAIYGVIRGGNAYLPIDPNYPQERIDYILENSSAKAVITQDKYIHLASNTKCIDMTAFIENIPANGKTPCNAEENDTAYVIYTSGSTGNPKGAKISHKSAVNRILWMHDKYPLEENDVILQKTPYTFDVSVWELFWWGMVGAGLAASKPDEHFLPAKILEEVEKNKVTHLHFVPSVFDIFLTYLENNPKERDKFNTVKYVFLSGEALTANHITRFYKMYDYEKVTLHNLYGPTECAVDVSYYDCMLTDTDPVPIGKPIYNTQLYVVDKYLNPAPIGVVGELCIGGMNVGQGYLNNEQLTNEKFIDNPFHEGKIYKTGDLAYWREDGEIIFCGRMDHQIKLNGQRVELGEIEKAISEVSGIDSVAVIIKQNNNKDVLVAFCCGDENLTSEIIKYCESKLPQYMVPSKFVFVEKMPLNQSGKLDRKALKNIDVVFDDAVIKEEPVTDTEKMLCKLFEKTLRLDFVGRNESFFTLGGTSLDMISILSENELKDVSSADFIANPTAEKLASLLEQKSEYKTEYLETLWKAPSSEKAIVLFPFAGGGAEAFANFVDSIKRTSDDISIYFVRYLHSKEECEKAAKEIAEKLADSELYFYSHCVGSAVAMQILNIIEKDDKRKVKHYIAGGNIPAERPARRNSWDFVPNIILRNILIKAGAPLKTLSSERVADMLKNFRCDTDFATQYYYEQHGKVKCPLSLVINKKDIFTKNHEKAEQLWKNQAENLQKIYYIDSTSHYFQSENSDKLVEIILSIID